MMSTPLDPRLHAYRPDLAAAELEGRVEAKRFVTGKPRRVAAASTPVHAQPSPDSEMTSEALFGETVTVFEESGGWAWGQLVDDGYVGYLPASMLDQTLIEPTHIVAVASTLVFSGSNIKSPAPRPLPLNAQVAVTGGEGALVALATGGYVPASHLAPLDAHASDFVAVAEQFRGAPYLWGGKQWRGLDCSGLIQIALHAAGISCPRDTDMQQAMLGGDLDPIETREFARGDIIFWRGHVGVMVDGEQLLHANAFHMATVIEPRSDAVGRIARSAGAITAIKRLV